MAVNLTEEELEALIQKRVSEKLEEFKNRIQQALNEDKKKIEEITQKSEARKVALEEARKAALERREKEWKAAHGDDASWEQEEARIREKYMKAALERREKEWKAAHGD